MVNLFYLGLIKVLPLFGSEALGLIVFVILLPLALMTYFKNRPVTYSIILFWLTALFSLSLKLYFYIPTAFAGANLQTPSWAGSLIIYSALIIFILVGSALLPKYWMTEHGQPCINFQNIFLLLSFVVAVLPVLVISYGFATDKGGYGQYAYLISQDFWIIPAVFAIALSLFRQKFDVQPPAIVMIVSSLLLVTGIFLFYRVLVTVLVTGQPPITQILPGFYRIFLYASAAFFISALGYAYWRQNKNKRPRQ